MNKITTVSEYENAIKTEACVIKVSASWCNPCKTLASMIDTFKDDIKKLFVEIDVVEAEEELINKLRVRNVPVLIFYKDGQEVNRFVGVKFKEDILAVIKNNLHIPIE